MAQLINLYWNNSFVNKWWLPLLLENFGVIALPLPDLAGRLAGRWNIVKFKKIKFYSYGLVP